MGMGNHLKDILSMKGISIKELSKQTGIPVNTLYSITKRDTKNIRVENLQKIADALGFNVNTLISWDSNKTYDLNTEVDSPALKLETLSFNSNEYSYNELKLIKQFADFLKYRRSSNSKEPSSF